MAESAKQRMVSSSRGDTAAGLGVRARGVRGAAFWAWTVSVALHLVVLAVFGVVRFSRVEAREQSLATPSGRLRRVHIVAQSAAVSIKPKIKPASSTPERRLSARLADGAAAIGGVFESVKAPLQSWDDIGSTQADDLRDEFSGRIEFFGSGAVQRKVCYVVDCSGSMKGIFGSVRRKLKESITDLQPDQYFYVIFFGGGRLFEVGEGRLLRATAKAKSAANSFIDSIRPAGRTNAAAALERVVRIRDAKGMSASVVYFLTDGFELSKADQAGFSQRIGDLLDRFAPGMRINTIGFLPREDDRRMLEAVARRSGGEFTCIEGR